MVTFFIAMGLCVVAIIQFSISKTSSLAEAQSIASSTALKYLLLSVMFNSIGYLAYTPLIAAPKEFNVSIYIIIALVVTPLASYAYSVLFQNGTITVKNLLCIGAIVAGIIGLKMK
jgi:multidrug transporter EmrE-like cation transporter